MKNAFKLFIALVLSFIIGVSSIFGAYSQENAEGSDAVGDIVSEKTVYDLMEQRIYYADDDEGTTLYYRMWVPENYDKKQRYPLLLFLHGAGERGTDNSLQLLHCMPYMITECETIYKNCIVIAPQCPQDNMWVDTPWEKGGYSIDEVPESNELTATISLINELKNEFNIDSNRIYCSGVSMGGFGVWDLLTRHNDFFAAGVAMCGSGDVSKADILKDTLIYAFHGEKDTAVPVSGTRDMIEEIKDIGGTLINYTEYENQDHNIWETAVRTEGMWEDLLNADLSQRYPEKIHKDENSSSVIIWIIIALFSAAIIIAVIIVLKRKNKIKK